jgi:hypothetical protein
MVPKKIGRSPNYWAPIFARSDEAACAFVRSSQIRPKISGGLGQHLFEFAPSVEAVHVPERESTYFADVTLCRALVGAGRDAKDLVRDLALRLATLQAF